MKKVTLLIISSTLLLAACGGGEPSSILSSSSENNSSAISSIFSSEHSSESRSSPSSVSSSELSSESSSEAISYTSKEIGVKYARGNAKKSSVRFYEGSDIPYIGFNEYFSILTQGKGSFTVEKLTNSIYNLRNFLGVESRFNLENNTFSTPDFNCFHSTDLTITKELPRNATDGLPFIKFSKFTTSNEPSMFTLNFSKYGIKMYGDEKDIYLPYNTVADIFKGQDLVCSSFDGSNLFVYYQNKGENFSDFEGQFKPFQKTPSADYALYNYHELCLSYDHFTGRPGRSALEKYYDLSKGLDAALKERPLGIKIARLLQSNNYEDYIVGLSIFTMLAGDGGHTSYSTFFNFNSQPEIYTQELLMNVDKKVDAIVNGGYEELTNRCVSYNYHGDVRNARKNAFSLDSDLSSLRGEKTYYASNDTAFIFIDDFMGEVFNQHDWSDYYSGKTDTLPYSSTKGGSVVSLVKGLEKAHSNPSIKNVVIDLTSNMGGSMDELMFMLNVLTKRNSFSAYDRVSKQTCTYEYQLDLNFDRVFDEKDLAVDYVGDLKVALLVSQCAFSCGGIGPVLLHDAGIYTIGDNCGGGSCSILGSHDIYGLYFNNSSSNMVVTSKGIGIDQAKDTSCDTKIEIGNLPGGRLDFSNFYDVSKLSELIKNH